MKITASAINSIRNITNIVNNKGVQKTQQLQNDTFIRTCSFGQTDKEDSKSFDKFKQWSDEVGFLDFAQEIISKTWCFAGKKANWFGERYKVYGTDAMCQ